MKLRPAAALDARVLAAVREAKPQLIALLQSRGSAAPPSPMIADETPRDYSQPQRDALSELARAVEGARVGASWCNPTPRVLEAWRQAEKVCGHPLTISGAPRREFPISRLESPEI